MASEHFRALSFYLPYSRRGLNQPERIFKAAGWRLPEYFLLDKRKKEQAMLGTILIVVLILALVGALPRWPHSREWGYAPTGGLGLALTIVVILLLLGRL
jgi:hypothetical protein